MPLSFLVSVFVLVIMCFMIVLLSAHREPNIQEYCLIVALAPYTGQYTHMAIYLMYESYYSTYTGQKLSSRKLFFFFSSFCFFYRYLLRFPKLEES